MTIAKYLIVAVALLHQFQVVSAQGEPEEKSLETNPACSSTGGAGGIWFDTVAKNDITVTSLGFETSHPSGTMAQLKIYTKEGTHQGFERDSSAWTEIFNDQVELQTRRPNGAWPPSSTQLGDDVISQFIKEGATQAFYLSLDKSVTYGQNFKSDNSDKCVGCLQSEDENIQQLTGSTECGAGTFGCFNTIKLYNGFIHYTVGGVADSFQIKTQGEELCLEPADVSLSSLISTKTCDSSNDKQKWSMDEFGHIKPILAVDDDWCIGVQATNAQKLQLQQCTTQTSFIFDEFDSSFKYKKDGRMVITSPGTGVGRKTRMLRQKFTEDYWGQTWELV